MAQQVGATYIASCTTGKGRAEHVVVKVACTSICYWRGKRCVVCMSGCIGEMGTVVFACVAGVLAITLVIVPFIFALVLANVLELVVKVASMYVVAWT